jgi:ABC-2 type transport system ATP-binding protein
VFEAVHLSKRYASTVAVDDVSFEIAPGEILGYLGPNGSGKSTTVQMVVGLLDPTRGTLRLHGREVEPADPGYRRCLGYVPEEPHLYDHLTATEYLTLVGRLRGLPGARLERRRDPLLALMGLHESRHAAMTEYSKGMRQRVLLAAALMHDPELLVLDEPFSGLDVSAALLFRSVLHALAGAGRMILFSSHRLDVVEKVCSRVVILHKGRVVAQDTVANLRGTLASRSLEDVFAAVTRQEDYTAQAKEILDVVSRA